MAEPKKPAKDTESQPIADVAHPGKSKPANTSKPVIVGHGPILKDPMVVEEESSAGEKIEVKTTGKATIQPLGTAESEKTAAPEPEPETEPEAEQKPEQPPQPEKEEPAAPSEAEPAEPPTEPEAPEPAPAADEPAPAKPSPAEEKKPDKPVDPKAEEAKAAEEAAKHDEAIGKLVESKKYYLPINSVERRRSKRLVALGVLLSLVLALAWLDVALDAGLVHLGGLKAVTHFFST